MQLFSGALPASCIPGRLRLEATGGLAIHGYW